MRCMTKIINGEPQALKVWTGELNERRGDTELCGAISSEGPIRETVDVMGFVSNNVLVMLKETAGFLIGL